MQVTHLMVHQQNTLPLGHNAGRDVDNDDDNIMIAIHLLDMRQVNLPPKFI